MLLRKLLAGFCLDFLYVAGGMFLGSLGFVGIWLALYFCKTTIVLSIALIIFSLSCFLGYLKLIILSVRRVNKIISEEQERVD